MSVKLIKELRLQNIFILIFFILCSCTKEKKLYTKRYNNIKSEITDTIIIDNEYGYSRLNMTVQVFLKNKEEFFIINQGADEKNEKKQTMKYKFYKEIELEYYGPFKFKYRPEIDFELIDFVEIEISK